MTIQLRIMMMKTLRCILPLFLFTDLTHGGYVSNHHINNAAASRQSGGYPFVQNNNVQVGGYPFPIININHHQQESYQAPAPAQTGGYSAPATGGYSAQLQATAPADGYGAPCCPNKYPFLPAPPGHTPPCSKHGSTFCETLENYPIETIRYLLYKYGSNYSPFIKTELNQDFIMMTQNYSYYYPKPEYGANLLQGYGAPSAQYVDDSYNIGHINSTFYEHPQQHPEFQYGDPAPFNLQQTQFQHQQSPSSTFPLISPHQAAALALPPLLNSMWWNHRDKRTNRPAFPYILEQRVQRVKRQATDDNQLCPLSSRFITPRAAMNNQGNWMYLVNMDGTQYIQQVKTEVCANGDGSACNGLCSIPPGFRSSCRQKYVQKRLVALDASGESLKNEVFWFPHCCVCEVTRG